MVTTDAHTTNKLTEPVCPVSPHVCVRIVHATLSYSWPLHGPFLALFFNRYDATEMYVTIQADGHILVTTNRTGQKSQSRDLQTQAASVGLQTQSTNHESH